MSQMVSRVGQLVVATAFLVLSGATAALAGPAPIEPEAPPATTSGQGGGFPWAITGAAVLLVVAVVALFALVTVLRRRAQSGPHRVVTP